MKEVYLLGKDELLSILENHSSFVRGILLGSDKTNTLIDHLYLAFDQSRDKATALRSDYLSRSIDEFDISRRARNVLDLSGVKTVSDLARRSRVSLRAIRGCGDVTLYEIENEILEPIGLRLKLSERD